MSDCLIIAGFHRSGTSLAAGWLQAAGLDLGDRLLPANTFNPRGYFEDQDVFELHERLLARHGTNWQFCDEAPLKLTTRDRLEIKELATARSSRGRPWGFKDPRVCLFLNEWMAEIPEAGVLIVYRHWAECSRSLCSRAATSLCTRAPEVGGDDLALFVDPERPLKMWLAYNRRLVEFIERHSQDCLVVSHGALVKGFPLATRVHDRYDLALRDVRASVVDPHLVHHDTTSPQPDWISPELVEQLHEVWNALNSHAEAPSSNGGRRTRALAGSAHLLREIDATLPVVDAGDVETPLASSVELATATAGECREEAWALMQSGRPRAALAWALRAMELGSNSATFALCGHVHVRLGNLDAARTAFRGAIDVGPARAAHYAHLAHIAMRRHEIEEALALVEQALELEPDNVNFCVARGRLRQKTGDLEGATRDFRAVLESEPGNPAGVLGLVSVLCDRRQLDQASDALTSLLDDHPDCLDAELARAVVLMEMGEYQRGMDMYTDALRRAFEPTVFRRRLEEDYLRELPTEQARAHFLTATLESLREFLKPFEEIKPE